MQNCASAGASAEHGNAAHLAGVEVHFACGVVGVTENNDREGGLPNPQDIIGEASYAMAVELGIDPDPSTGGIEGGVAYIAFTGVESKVGTIEDHDEATTLGVERAKLLLATP